MRAYVATTGVIFLLLAVMHVVRAAIEGMWLFREPIFLLMTLLSLASSGWAALVWRRLAARG